MSSSAITTQIAQLKVGNVQNQADSTSIYSSGQWSFKNSTALPSVTITDAGNVGINAVSPTSRLTIGTGTFTAAAAQTTGMYTNGTNGLVVLTDAMSVNSRTGTNFLNIDALGAFTFQTTSNVGSAKAFLIKNAGETSNGRNTVTLDAANVGNNSSMISFAKSGGAIWNVLVDRTATGTSDFGIISSSGNGVYLANTSSTSWTGTSDKRVKKNIQPLELGLEQIKALKPSRFDYNTDESEESARVGFIAQEVLPVLPHAVHVPEDSEQMMGVSATEMIPVLVKAIQELSAQVEELKAKLP